MTDDVQPNPQQAAQKLFSDAKDAMLEVSRQIAGAKETLKDYMATQHLDINNKDDVETAKKKYQASLKVTVVDDPRVPGANELMEKMYGLYTATFPIPEEREELAKLKDLLTKNHDAALQAHGAPFKEQWIMVQDASGEVVAATNIITFSAAKDPKVASEVDGTTHLTYIFVDPRYRSLGLGDFALKNAEDEARKVVAATYNPPRDPSTVDLVQIAEQNAPLELTLSSSLTDTAGAKIDQFYRRKYFEGLGFRELGFHYTQLPLEPRDQGGEPGEGMNLIVRGLPAPDSHRNIPHIMTSLSSDALRFHLYNFFDRSVAAGQYEIESDPDWIRQAGALHGQLKVKPSLDFMSLQKKSWDFVDKYVHGKTFNADEFENAPLGKLMQVNEIPALQMNFKLPAAKADFCAAASPEIAPPVSPTTRRAASAMTPVRQHRPPATQHSDIVPDFAAARVSR